MSMVLGYRSGFVWTFFHALSWIAAIVLAFMWKPRVSEFLIENTGIYESVNQALTERIADTVNINNISAEFPRIMRETVDSLILQAASAASTALCSLIFTVISFLIVVFAVKFVFFIIILLFSKRYSDGAAGFIDGFAGLVFGFIRGAFLIFVLLAALIPFLGLFDARLTEFIGNSLDSSFVAGSLYDNNFLALIVRDFLF